VLGIVSGVVAVPVVNAVELTDAAQVGANRARASVTVTAPSCPLVEAPGATEDNSFDAGTVIERPPAADTVNVTVVSPEVAAFADPLVATVSAMAAATVAPTITRSPKPVLDRMIEPFCSYYPVGGSLPGAPIDR
jgi:hypothetical protein